MPRSRDEWKKLIPRAAELRQRGASWDAVAADVRRSVETVRDWPRKYPKEWRHACRAAKRQVNAEARAESLQTLRLQLRSEDEKASRDAATAILKLAKPTARAKPQAKKSQLSSEMQAIAEYVQELSDEDLDHLLRELAEANSATAGDAATPEVAAHSAS
jgi:transposase